MGEWLGPKMLPHEAREAFIEETGYTDDSPRHFVSFCDNPRRHGRIVRTGMYLHLSLRTQPRLILRFFNHRNVEMVLVGAEIAR